MPKKYHLNSQDVSKILYPVDRNNRFELLYHMNNILATRAHLTLSIILLTLAPTDIFAGKTSEEAKAFEGHLQVAKAGNMWALYSVGLDYEFGRGTEINLPKALESYQKAAEAGSGFAQLKLAQIYDSGDWASKFRTKSDPDLAFIWYKRAAEHGIVDALLRMSTYHGANPPHLSLNAVTVEKDIQKSWAYYKVAQIFLLTSGSDPWQIQDFGMVSGFSPVEIKKLKSDESKYQEQRLLTYDRFMKPLLITIRENKVIEEKSFNDFPREPFSSFDHFEPAHNVR